MKVAIIGGGISGLMVAEQLEGVCDYTLFEKSDYIGGHTDTHTVKIKDKDYQVDTGFIVCNRNVYKHFFQMLDKYNIQTQKSDMSFAVNNLDTGLVYNATNLTSLFCQKKNLFNPKFYRMIRDIFKFYNQAEKILQSDTDITLGNYLNRENYSQYFIDEHLLPMASALWSGDFESVKKFPLVYLLSFMKNHQMLQANQRPTWETIKGGSNQYVKKLTENLTGQLLTNTKVNNVIRLNNSVVIQSDEKNYEFDRVFFASHSDQTLNLIENPTTHEKEIFSDIPYVNNTIDLHTDRSIMPKQMKAWASWIVNKYPNQSDKKNQCTVNYYMNLLQNIDCPEPLIVSLNQSEHINDDKKLKTVYYQHPVYTMKTILAQSRKAEIQAKNNSYFCGAYWGWGFHEDGAKSAVEAVNQFKKTEQVG
ncbi:MAG: FAD-dependent oxidoreductase [Flavobacteriaceae bacterium]|nr:FAD-dependent oxidoreductase [Flavobacteriaceae bacterium]